MTNFIITNGCIVTPDGVLEDGWVHCQNGQIIAIGSGTAPEGQTLDAEGGIVLPGFIDVHVHGAIGYDTMDADLDSFLQMAAFFGQCGVTSFLPTTLTASRQQTTNALRTIKQAMLVEHQGARIAGAHLEGPYLHPDRSGAQNKDFIRSIDRDEFQEWLAMDVIRLVSVAPEQDDIAWLIESCVEHGVTVSAAHTTSDYDTAQAAIAAGLSHSTHTYNAMPKLHHREPGALAALMLADTVNCELIADNVHVHPGMMALLYRIIGVERLILITDGMRAAGMADGSYHLGDYDVTVREGIARLGDGTLAGSTLTMNEGVANFCQAVGQPVETIWQVTSHNAARAIGLSQHTGCLAAGYDADIVILAPDTSAIVRATIVQGQIIYQAE